jgi:hypothetical protein
MVIMVELEAAIEREREKISSRRLCGGGGSGYPVRKLVWRRACALYAPHSVAYICTRLQGVQELQSDT